MFWDYRLGSWRPRLGSQCDVSSKHKWPYLVFMATLTKINNYYLTRLCHWGHLLRNTFGDPALYSHLFFAERQPQVASAISFSYCSVSPLQKNELPPGSAWTGARCRCQYQPRFAASCSGISYSSAFLFQHTLQPLLLRALGRTIFGSSAWPCVAKHQPPSVGTPPSVRPPLVSNA